MMTDGVAAPISGPQVFGLRMWLYRPSERPAERYRRNNFYNLQVLDISLGEKNDGSPECRRIRFGVRDSWSNLKRAKKSRAVAGTMP